MTFTPCERCAQPKHCAANGCFGEKARSVGFTSTVTSVINQAEAAQRRDMDAYRRLRNDGIQPSQIYGSAALETIDDRHVIEAKPDPKEVERYQNEAPKWQPSPT